MKYPGVGSDSGTGGGAPAENTLLASPGEAHNLRIVGRVMRGPQTGREIKHCL